MVYTWSGFFQPIDNDATNEVRAGRAIPVKFDLGGDQGLGIFAAGTPTSSEHDCRTADQIDPIEETITAGGSSLSYDPASGHYVYVWKTDKAWADQCRTLTMTLIDGTTHTADFTFTR